MENYTLQEFHNKCKMNVLTRKSYKTSQSKLSRYASFPIYYHTLDDKYVAGTTAYLKDTTPYSIHIVQPGDSYDSLALEYYNNPTYYWVICSFNHVQDPFLPLAQGAKLKIPALSSIVFDM